MAAQLLLGVSLAVTVCGVLALTVDQRDAYLLTVGFALAASVAGLGARGHRLALTVLALAVPAAALTLTVLLSLPWLLAATVALMCEALLRAPTLLRRRTWSLLLPVAVAAAATTASVAATFYASPAPNVPLTTVGEGTLIWLRQPPGANTPTSDLFVYILFGGCERPVEVAFDWQAARPGAATGRNLRAVLTAGYASQSQTATNSDNPTALSFVSLTPRGIGSCYLALPGYIGPWPGDTRRPDEFPPPFWQGRRRLAVTLAQAQTSVFLGGSTVSVLGGAAPASAGDPSVWVCDKSSQNAPFPTGCSALVLLTDPWFGTFQNVMLVVIGALAAALVGLVGRAAASLSVFAD